MEPDHKTLDAFVDGELPPGEMERIAALLEARPDLNRYVREQERVRAKLKTTFDRAVELADRERLEKTVLTAPVSWRLRLRALRLSNIAVQFFVPMGAALALGLVIGVGLRPSPEFSIDAAGGLVARGELDHALSTRLASVRYNGIGPRIGISFRNRTGEDCRTFVSGNSAGLACHQNGHWVVGMLVKQRSESPGATYRMAGSEMPDVVRRAVKNSIVGAPFGPAAEKEARDRGWPSQ